MSKKETERSNVVGQMALADQVMREDKAVLAALVDHDAGLETQLNVSRRVARQRRRALRKLADS